jgi:hypothetical protein
VWHDIKILYSTIRKKETYNSKNTCGVIEEINFAIFVVGVMVNKKVTI